MVSSPPGRIASLGNAGGCPGRKRVAALAGAQFVVTKEYVDARTHSQLRRVEGRARVEEIARMLGGKTESALAHAETLLRG